MQPVFQNTELKLFFVCLFVFCDKYKKETCQIIINVK